MNKDDLFDLDEELKVNTSKNPGPKPKPKKKNKGLLVLLYFTMLFLIIAVSFDVMFLYMNKQNEQKIADLTKEKEAILTEQAANYITKEEAETLASEEVEKALSQVPAVNSYESVEGADGREQLKEEIIAMFENGDNLLKILENVYEEKIVVPDNSGYYFFDVDESLEKNGLDFEKFIYPELNEESGKLEGIVDYKDDEFEVKRGVDVSKFQGEIDWQKVIDDGIEFAFLRCAFRGYESGKIVEDETFENNIKACNELGLDVGCYFFTEAKTEEEGIEEADFVLNLLEEYEVDVQLPIVIDVEQSSNTSKSRTKDVTPEQRTKVVIAFCERIKQAGYEPMIYGNLKSHMRMTDIYQLEEYGKWFAYYRTPLRYPYKFSIWQYTSAGSVDGIKGDTDLNLMFIKK